MGRDIEQLLSEKFEKAAEGYWLSGMDLGQAKRRASVEQAQERAQRGDETMP